MRLRRITSSVVGALIFSVASLFAQGMYKVEPIGAPPSDLPKTLQDALQSTGVRLVNGQGGAVCELWLLKSIPTQQSSGGSAEVLYGNLSVGTMVGVLRFPNGGSDFRGQQIKPGIYTLRYAMIPQDGNHMGVSTYRDFLLLGPVAADSDANKVLTFDALVKLSRQASGTPHPAVISLSPATDAKLTPEVVQDDQGHWVLHIKAEGKSTAGVQDFPIAIVLVGKAEAG